MPFPTATLPRGLYTAAQVRELDRTAIQGLGIPGAVLMDRAGEAAYRALRVRWPEARALRVLCGAGNNGGDGYVLARRARADGLQVALTQVGDPARLQADALAAAQGAREAGLEPEAYAGEHDFPEAVVVDALLGTGLDRDLGGDWAGAVEAINASPGRALAVDIPTGLHADSGAVLGRAVRADLTVTFMGLKRGLFTGAGPEVRGALLYHDLEVPGQVFADALPSASRLGAGVGPALVRRAATAHKGHFGHVLVVGGERGYAGAARLAGEAALRCGAGLVSVATRPENVAAMVAGRPELMVHPVTTPEDLGPLIERASVIAVGPGLSRSRWGAALLAAVLESDLPLVVDADALNLLSESPRSHWRWVLTPHPGEAARLLGISAAEVQANRFAALQGLCERYGGVCVLKGAGTLVGGREIGVCDRGNPGLATGGTGDVLSGVIAALLAQGLEPEEAARMGVCLHGEAGDRVAREGQRGLIASDLFVHLWHLVNPPLA